MSCISNLVVSTNKILAHEAAAVTFDRLSNLDMDGKEISDVVTTAASEASKMQEGLSIEHIHHVLQNRGWDRDVLKDEDPDFGYEKTWKDLEFVSSAISVRDTTGKVKAVKIFYDVMSTDNWASEKFAEAFGFPKRPILPDDLNTYETLNGDYTPTHYIEIELQDKSRGMKEFAKMSLNVAPSMDGIGLVAGVDFMRKHCIRTDVTAHRDSSS